MKTVYSLQVLRGIAAFMVVLAHTYAHLDTRHIIQGIPGLADAGIHGVDIFFVISGFVMVYISGDNFGKPGASRDFLIRRIIRVVPLYWFYTAAISVLLIFFPGDFSSGQSFDLSHLLASLSFIPVENSVGKIFPIHAVGWTLNYEMYFYLIFAFLLLFKKEWFLPLLSIILLAGVLTGMVIKQAVTPIFSVITAPLLIEFLM